MTKSNAIWNDAGLLRQDTVARYHSFLCFGGTLNQYDRVLNRAHRIAKLTGLTMTQVMNNLRDDAELVP